MPRRPRICTAGTCFHVINRAVARLPLFEKQEDHEAFEHVLRLASNRIGRPIFSYIVMSNHWHFAVRPETDAQVTEFFRWLTHTHTLRWHAHHHTEGTGHLYQGRFKTLPIEQGEHLLAVLRYVERNALRARLCKRAEDWEHGSLCRRVTDGNESCELLIAWPIARPRTWVAMANRALNPAKEEEEEEEEAIRQCLRKGQPFGGSPFVSQFAFRHKLQHTLRARGRPKKKSSPNNELRPLFLPRENGLARLP